jgi:hypothetical protein
MINKVQFNNLLIRRSVLQFSVNENHRLISSDQHVIMNNIFRSWKETRMRRAVTITMEKYISYSLSNLIATRRNFMQGKSTNAVYEISVVLPKYSSSLSCH